MIQSVDPISFPLIDDAAFEKEVVTIFERYDLLLFVGIEGRVILLVVDWGEFIVTSIPDHIICEVRHSWAERLL